MCLSNNICIVKFAVKCKLKYNQFGVNFGKNFYRFLYFDFIFNTVLAAILSNS